MSGIGLEVVPNSPDCRGPVLRSHRTYRCFGCRNCVPINSELTEVSGIRIAFAQSVSGTAIIVFVPNLPRCREPVLRLDQTIYRILRWYICRAKHPPVYSGTYSAGHTLALFFVLLGIPIFAPPWRPFSFPFCFRYFSVLLFFFSCFACKLSGLLALCMSRFLSCSVGVVHLTFNAQIHRVCFRCRCIYMSLSVS